MKSWHVTAFDIGNDLVDKQTWILRRTERDVNRAPVVTPLKTAQLDMAVVRSHHAMVSHVIDSMSAPPGG